MGAVDDPARTSVLRVPQPYMGLGATWAEPSTRWDEQNFTNMCINSCWELYGAVDLAHLPSSGSRYRVAVTRNGSSSWPWVGRWDEDEGANKTCATSTIREEHNATTQLVAWDIGVPAPSEPLQERRARSTSPGAHDLRTNALFSDHAVIQDPRLRADSAPTTIHGTASPGAVVALSGLPGGPQSAPPAASDGSWALEIQFDDPAAAEGPYDLTLASTAAGATLPARTLVARDVYFGEVFLCSGQSNMERTVDYIINATAELAAANHPAMRLFQVPSQQPGPKGPWHAPSRQLDGSCLTCLDPPECTSLPGKDCVNPAREWAIANASVVAKFSAVCYLSVRDAMASLGRLRAPIGLIESDWGGTPVQAWTPPDALRRCGMPASDCPTEVHTAPSPCPHPRYCTPCPF